MCLYFLAGMSLMAVPCNEVRSPRSPTPLALLPLFLITREAGRSTSVRARDYHLYNPGKAPHRVQGPPKILILRAARSLPHPVRGQGKQSIRRSQPPTSCVGPRLDPEIISPPTLILSGRHAMSHGMGHIRDALHQGWNG